MISWILLDCLIAITHANTQNWCHYFLVSQGVSEEILSECTNAFDFQGCVWTNLEELAYPRGSPRLFPIKLYSTALMELR